MLTRISGTLVALVLLTASVSAEEKKKLPPLIQSARSGDWSVPATWKGGKVPAAGSRVQIQSGHAVVYNVKSTVVLRSIHVSGTLTFARDRDTRLEVGLIKIQPGSDASEEGFDCDDHIPEVKPGSPRPVLEVGSPNRPIPAKYTALIRLHFIEGMDKKSCPAIVCCGGRMDLHGAPLARTWVKLNAAAKKNDTEVSAMENVPGWRSGDRIIITATAKPTSRTDLQTEERIIKSIKDKTITIDKPLEYSHTASGDYRAEVANLSRNVIIESADPKGERGHTMYHRGSAGAISYAEFRHLGKEGVLGRYSIHYHLVGGTMRGSYVLGASIWDSHNRWVTIHGTSYLVVRDCVGYKSKGHGYFLEDGTEVYNLLDRNLAVQAMRAKPLPRQVLPFDQNEGAGFWWANSLNTFTRNVTCENGRYGYRFEATPSSRFNLTLNIRQGDGSKKKVDIRTLPFVRFANNEAHSDGLYGVNMGEGVARVGPDAKHPFVMRNTTIWEVHYAFRVQVPSLLNENMKIHRAHYGVYHPNYDRHVYKNILISETDTEPFNRGHDDDSNQYGILAVDGLTFAGNRMSGMPLIQISDHNPTGKAESHFRNVKVIDRRDSKKRALVNRGGGPRPEPKTKTGVPIYLHDWFGKGKHAKVVSTKAKDFGADGLTYRSETGVTGNESRITEVKDVPFPVLLEPSDDLPPITVITHVGPLKDGKVTIRGTASDNGSVKKVTVNGVSAKAIDGDFAVWEVTLDKVKAGELKLKAHAEDAAGNVEKTPHLLTTKR